MTSHTNPQAQTPLPPLFRKIDCIRLSVTDLEAGLQFYRDRLGHSLIWRTPQDAGLRLPGTDAEIVLHTEPAEPEIDLKVSSAEEAAARFEAAGGQVLLPPFDIQIGRAVLVQDPWGNRLLLLDATKGLLLTDENGTVIGNSPPARAGEMPSGLDGLELRLASEADADALCSLYYEFHEFHVRGVPDRLHSLGEKDHQDWTRLRSALAEIFGSPEAAIFLAQVSGETVGLVEVYLRQDDESNSLIFPYRYGYIQSLVVLEPYRRMGIGGKLVETAQTWAKEKGATEMRLETWEFDAGPLPFYENIGFRTIKRTLIKDLSSVQDESRMKYE